MEAKPESKIEGRIIPAKISYRFYYDAQELRVNDQLISGNGLEEFIWQADSNSVATLSRPNNKTIRLTSYLKKQTIGGSEDGTQFLEWEMHKDYRRGKEGEFENLNQNYERLKAMKRD
jgi:hypothetical protein